MSAPSCAAPNGWPNVATRALTTAEIHARFVDGVVRHGPFAGLRYPRLQSVGSSLIPKLLGSYEAELHPWIEAICATDYSDVIDIGCAEGYYAVGLAIRMPGIHVHAYDIDATAQALCLDAARLNGVDSRTTVHGQCSAAAVTGLTARRRGLIVCDCEGAELDLFTEHTVTALAGWDLLIETHDFLDITGSTRLAGLFAGTHEVQTCLSVDDIQKAKHYDYPELAGLDLPTRRAMVGEGRPATMEWLLCKSRVQPL